MTKYPASITKFIKDTFFKAANFNVPITELEQRTDSNRALINDAILSSNKLIINNQPMTDNVTTNRVVYFNGTKWDTLNALNTIGEVHENFPLGISRNIEGIPSKKSGEVILNGIIQDIDTSIVEDSVELGKPYFLSITNNGKLTKTQPVSPVFVGTFITLTTFHLNFQFMAHSHIHRRVLLTPSEWIDNHPTNLLYPVEELGQVPLPFKSAVLVVNEQYFPVNDERFEVDLDGIKITDFTYFASILGVAENEVYDTISDSDFKIELFYTDPRSLTTPGVQRLESGTTNITLQNRIVGQPSDVGSLIIKNIPKVVNSQINSSGSTVVKDISVNSSTGEISITKGPVVEKISEGNNVTISGNGQGKVIVAANSGRFTELEFNEVRLLGSSSRIVSNSLLTNVGYSHEGGNAAIYKLTLPDTLDPTNGLEIFAYHFGDASFTGGTSIPIKVKYMVYRASSFASSSPVQTNVNLPVESAFKISKTKVTGIPNTMLSTNCIVTVSLERSEDTNYEHFLGVSSLVCKFKVQ